LIKTIKTNLRQNGIFKIIITDNTVAGFCFVYKYLSTNNNIPEFAKNNKTDKIAVIQTLAVLPKYQRKGLGTILLTDILADIKKQYKKVTIYYPFWAESKSANFYKILIKLGFSKVKEYPHYWHNDSLNNNYRCAACKSIPCECSMHLYKL
jgi:ribosomal protein S18 acetylase RimI-like enzyme